MTSKGATTHAKRTGGDFSPRYHRTEPTNAAELRRTTPGLSILAVAIFYLAGPLLIVWELFKPELSVPILLACMMWAFTLARSAVAFDKGRTINSSLLVSLVLLTLCVAWIYFSGIGSYAMCRWDYVKHNIMFSYLLDHKLPIETNWEGRRFILHYSLAYYITPVRLKEAFELLLPHASLNFILFLTYSSAVYFSLWILARGEAMFALVLFFVMSLAGGLDLLGMVAFNVKPIVATLPGLDIGIPMNTEWWGVPYAPQSLTMNLYWAPQHFFAALIGTALVFAFMQFSRPLTVTLVDASIVVAASVFWSPYSALGLAVLTLLKFVIDNDGRLLRKLCQEGVAPLLTFWSLFACAFAAALALAAWLFLAAAVPLSPPRLLINYSNVRAWLLTYSLNYAPLILAFILTCWPHAWGAYRNVGPEQAAYHNVHLTLAACLTASAAILLFTHGYFNDWAMRTTLPLSIALAVALTQVLLGKMKWAYLAGLFAILPLSSASSMSEIALGALAAPNCAPYGAFSLKDIGPLASQYEGRPDSILYRYLVRSR
jgi:hypothetical protein